MINKEILYGDLSSSDFDSVGLSDDGLHFIFKSKGKYFGVKVKTEHIITMDYKVKEGEK